MIPHSSADTRHPPRVSDHSNAFGFLRLLFASLVIVSHTPEILHGNRDREVLTALFGTISFGEFAVDGFFLISGYLITASFKNSSSAASYLSKRVARIYPGFICAYCLCILIVAPLGGAQMPQQVGQYASIVVRAILLLPPDIGTVFYGTPYEYLNSSMWTISIEFRCYLVVLVLGILGIFKIRSAVLICTSILLIYTIAMPEYVFAYEQTAGWRSAPNMFSGSEWVAALLGNKKESLKLCGIFLTGSCFYLYRDHLNFRINYILLATILLLASLFVDRLVTIGVALCGGYLILSVAELNKGNTLSRINNENDVSYGLYLYAFPTTKLIVHFVADASLLTVGILTFLMSYGLGWISWLVVEKPIMRWVRPPAGSPPFVRPRQIRTEFP